MSHGAGVVNRSQPVVQAPTACRMVNDGLAHPTGPPWPPRCRGRTCFALSSDWDRAACDGRAPHAWTRFSSARARADPSTRGKCVSFRHARTATAGRSGPVGCSCGCATWRVRASPGSRPRCARSGRSRTPRRVPQPHQGRTTDRALPASQRTPLLQSRVQGG